MGLAEQGKRLKFGDRNTNFFNNFASARKKRNFIRRLMDENGNWLEDNDSMRNIIEAYFKILLPLMLMYHIWMCLIKLKCVWPLI